MKFIVRPSKLSGEVEIPGSKSHTIRSLFFAMAAGGESVISSPLESADTRSAFGVCRAFGAEIEAGGGAWRVRGTGGEIRRPAAALDVGNSGTTMNFSLGMASLCGDEISLTGDAQIQRRPVAPLAEALNGLGARVVCEGGNGCPPVRVRGPLRGGKTALRAHSSQYLSSLLICCPLAAGDSDIEVLELNEAPYVEMTLWWLDRLKVKYGNTGLERFRIPGGQKYAAFEIRIPGDFSSATFFAAAAAATGSDLLLRGLDMTDTQGDKEVFRYLERMGAETSAGSGGIRVRGGNLEGTEIDMNGTPDALPAMAAAGCFARGETRLVNVPQARQKETDRIAVMAAELKKMGADIEELPDGLVVRGGDLRGAHVNGHGDHRVVMALAVAGLAAGGETVIDTAESAAVTFPGFRSLMNSIGADIEALDR